MECNENKLEKIRKTLQKKRSERKLRRKKKKIKNKNRAYRVCEEENERVRISIEQN
jgi:hypothetical protein